MQSPVPEPPTPSTITGISSAATDPAGTSGVSPQDNSHNDSDEARRARRRVAAESRKRIANACLACKTRKQKCDGQRPCNICKRRSAECVYVEQPARSAKRQRTGSRYTESLPDENPTHSPSQPSRNSPPPPDAWGNSLPSADQNPGGAVAHPAATQATYTPSSSKPAPFSNEVSHIGTMNLAPESDMRGQQEQGEDERVEALVDHRTRMLSDPKGRLLYIGETGSLSFLARVRKMVSDTLGESFFTTDSAQNQIADRPSIPHVSHLGGQANMPDFQMLRELVNLFFVKVNAVHYVLDKEEVDRIMESLNSGTEASPITGNRDRDIAVINVICAIGSFFTIQPQLSMESGMSYFDTARTLMEDVCEVVDFWSVRLLLLFALYMHYAAKRNASWMYIGLAVRAAQSVGLHSITPPENSRSLDPQNTDTSNQRRRRYVFWTLYSLDRFLGCSLGRPFAIADEYCNDPIFSPDATKEAYLHISACFPSQPESVHLIHRAAAKVRLHMIMGYIVRSVYLKRHISRDVAETLSEQLKSWWRSIPPCASLNGGNDPAIIQLHMTYLHAVTLLTRPFLQRVVEESIQETTRDGMCQCANRNPKRTNVHRKMLRYAGACVLVAERTVTLAQRMRKRGFLQRNDATLIYYLFTSGLVLFFSSIPRVFCGHDDQPNGSSDPSQDLSSRTQPVISLLADCAAVESSTAKRYHSILIRFADALAEGKERSRRERPSSNGRGATGEPDLLDDLQAMSMDYSPMVATPSAQDDRQNLAAHALVQLHPSQNQVYYAQPDGIGFPVQEVGPTLGEEIHEKEMAGLNEFSSFFGWLEDGSPAVPWEFSWDGPAEDLFVTDQREPMNGSVVN